MPVCLSVCVSVEVFDRKRFRTLIETQYLLAVASTSTLKVLDTHGLLDSEELNFAGVVLDAIECVKCCGDRIVS